MGRGRTGTSRVVPEEPGGAPRGPVYPHLLAAATVLGVERVVGARYLSLAGWLRDFFAWPEDGRGGWREGRLREVLAHAGERVPFYRQVLGPAAGEASLVDLPVVDKATMRGDTAAFLSDDWAERPRMLKRTGGTSGDPWIYLLDKAAWGHIYGASLHFWERTGYRYGERIVLLGSPPSLVPDATSWKARLRYAAERRTVSAAGADIDPEASARRTRLASEAGGVLWFGYAGIVAAMADAVIDQGVPCRAPRAIVTTSEALLPAWRRRIEEAFAAPVFDLYACNDGGVLAQTCGRGRFHLADNVSIVEVLDEGRPCPPGVEGDVVVTNLHARVMPFLRYRVGDRAVLGEGTCPCGVPGRTLAHLNGREADHLALPGGRKLSPLPFANAFMTTPNVLRWQLVQAARSRVGVRLEVGPSFEQWEADSVHRFVQQQCGPDVRVEVTTREPMERTLGGKHKPVVRLFEG